MPGRGRAVRARLAGASTLALLAAAAVSGCESTDKEAAGQAAKLQTACAKDAKSVDLPTDFPVTAKLPDGYVVSAVEERDGGAPWCRPSRQDRSRRP
ncbi:MAG: hypothetical protein ACYDDU_09995 [Dermatophilaceae bacterium]